MNISLEKVITLFVIAAFFVTSVNSLSALGDPITKEEAIEISKNSELVKEGFAVAHSCGVEANYYNSSRLEELKNMKFTYTKKILNETTRLWEEVVVEIPSSWASIPIPEGHSIWQVVWDVNLGVGGYLVIVIIDAETGSIIHEETGAGYE